MTGTEKLLVDYVEHGSDQAFRELVAAYINFVFSTAVRVLGGDKGLAEDVSQTVFMDLARKAAGLPRTIKLGGWLHRHTCFVARKALRRERRRIAREQQAVQLNAIADYTAENLGHLAVVLDEAINDLGAKDRHAILLRFFEQRDFRSVGEALGSTEDGARMRVTRALEKMGLLLRRRGIVLSLAGLGFVLSTKTVTAAPAGLAGKISHLALAHAAKGLSVIALLKQTCLTRVNAGIVSVAAVTALLIFLIPARHSAAMIKGLETRKAGLAELEDSVPEEAAQPPENAPAPAANLSPAQAFSPGPEVVAHQEKPAMRLTAPIPISIVPTKSPAPTAALPAPVSAPQSASGGNPQAFWTAPGQGYWPGRGPGVSRGSPATPVTPVSQTAKNSPGTRTLTNNSASNYKLAVAEGPEWSPVQAQNDSRAAARTVPRNGNNNSRSTKRDNGNGPRQP